MNKKKEQNKMLQKRFDAIIKIYTDQKGKGKKKQLKEFIEQKMNEIILFSEALNTKAKKNKTSVMPGEGEINVEISTLQPSAELLTNHQPIQRQEHEDTTAHL